MPERFASSVCIPLLVAPGVYGTVVFGRPSPRIAPARAGDLDGIAHDINGAVLEVSFPMFRCTVALSPNDVRGLHEWITAQGSVHSPTSETT